MGSTKWTFSDKEQSFANIHFINSKILFQFETFWLQIKKRLIKLRSSHQRCSVKKVVLKYFTVFTGKNLCSSLFLMKMQAWRPAMSLKWDTNTCVFLWKLRNFKNGCFWKLYLDNQFGFWFKLWEKETKIQAALIFLLPPKAATLSINW